MKLQGYLDSESWWVASGPHCSNRCISRLCSPFWSRNHSQNHLSACCPQDESHSSAYVGPWEVGSQLVLRCRILSSAPRICCRVAHCPRAYETLAGSNNTRACGLDALTSTIAIIIIAEGETEGQAGSKAQRPKLCYV